jgi:signal transduction histidine kinase/CheY-like chemotaxis protein
VVLARQRARQLAGLLGFDSGDQVRIATAVSEIARNVFRYAGCGKAEFSVTRDTPPVFRIQVTDAGPGIGNLKEVLDGRYVSHTGMGLGIIGTRRLMDEFAIESAPGRGTKVLLGKSLPRHTPPITDHKIAELSGKLAEQPPQDPFEELQRQNQELLSTLEEVQRQKAELAQLNKELEDTNRGVVALYAELDERADYLRRASELKTQFLSNMTHEFRTPLNSILSLSRILLDRVDGELSAEQERQVKFIQKAANGLSELVNDLLDLAKVEAGKVVIHPAEFRIRDLFGALRGMLRPLLAHNSAVSLVFDDADDIPPVVTDESKVSQVLRNLISNALKYTERGEVRVGARLLAGEWLEIGVSDTGVGIAGEDQERIFEEFTQVEGEHQRGKRGTGLGLPLSRKLAELLGGSLSVQSELGAGSTFTLRVPGRYTGPAVVSEVPEIPAGIDPNRKPVLVVEDNPETLFIYEKYLKATPYQPIPARTLREAAAALDRFRPAAVILDVLLSHENTWTFLTEFKRNAATRDIPVIVVTMVENEHKAFALGADAFHAKPVAREWLLRQLDSLVPRAGNEEVLVVDDTEMARYVARDLLGACSVKVIEAADGREGLRIARERRPLAVILDLMMPGMSGFQVLDALEADPATRHLPVIVHTGKTLTAKDHEKLRGRVVAILQKSSNDRAAAARDFAGALDLARRLAAGREPEVVTHE